MSDYVFSLPEDDAVEETDAHRGRSRRGGWKKGVHKHREETKRKIARTMTGRKLTEETRRRISEARTLGMLHHLRVLREEVDAAVAEAERRWGGAERSARRRGIPAPGEDLSIYPK